MKNKTHVFGNLIEITLKVKTNFVRQKKKQNCVKTRCWKSFQTKFLTVHNIFYIIFSSVNSKLLCIVIKMKQNTMKTFLYSRFMSSNYIRKI